MVNFISFYVNYCDFIDSFFCRRSIPKVQRSENYLKCQSIVQGKLDVFVGWRQLLASISTIFSQTCQRTQSQIFWNPEEKIDEQCAERAITNFTLSFNCSFASLGKKKQNHQQAQQSKWCETANTGCFEYLCLLFDIGQQQINSLASLRAVTDISRFPRVKWKCAWIPIEFRPANSNNECVNANHFHSKVLNLQNNELRMLRAHIYLVQSSIYNTNWEINKNNIRENKI